MSAERLILSKAVQMAREALEESVSLSKDLYRLFGFECGDSLKVRQ